MLPLMAHSSEYLIEFCLNDLQWLLEDLEWQTSSQNNLDDLLKMHKFIPKVH